MFFILGDWICQAHWVEARSGGVHRGSLLRPLLVGRRLGLLSPLHLALLYLLIKWRFHFREIAPTNSSIF